MKFKTLAVAAALAASLPAFAVDTFSFGATHPSGSWADAFSFTVTAPGDLVGGSFATSGITGYAVSLFDSTFNQIGTADNTPASFSFSGLSAGTYTLAFVGAGAGSYGGAAEIAAVPEPETYALMLAGLGMVGFMAARRSRG